VSSKHPLTFLGLPHFYFQDYTPGERVYYHGEFKDVVLHLCSLRSLCVRRLQRCNFSKVIYLFNSVVVGRLLKVMIRQAAVQWVGSRQMARHRLLPLTASNAVFPATSSVSLSLINYGPQLQQPASHWAVPVTSFGRVDDVRLVALGNRDAVAKCDDSERRSVSVSDTQLSSRRCSFCLFYSSFW